MPSIPSQFFEVARLVPLALAATNSAAAAVMKLARDLRDSGSDFINHRGRPGGGVWPIAD